MTELTIHLFTALSMYALYVVTMALIARRRGGAR